MAIACQKKKLFNTYRIFIAIYLTNCYIKLHKVTQEVLPMYTVDETGVMNNYAVEPEVYFAEYPSDEQQRRYMLQAGFAALLVTATLCISLAVS